MRNIQEGFLRVVGENKLQLQLEGTPREVIVEFVDEDIVPCNHHHHHHHHGYHHHEHHQDKLVWRLAYKIARRGFFFSHKEYVLEIAWDVESIRTIKWVVIY